MGVTRVITVRCTSTRIHVRTEFAALYPPIFAPFFPLLSDLHVRRCPSSVDMAFGNPRSTVL